MRWIGGILLYVLVWMLVAIICLCGANFLVSWFQGNLTTLWSDWKTSSLGTVLLEFLVYGGVGISLIIAALGTVHLGILNAYDQKGQCSPQKRRRFSVRIGFIMSLPICVLALLFGAGIGWIYSIAGLVCFPCAGAAVGRFWPLDNGIDFRDW